MKARIPLFLATSVLITASLQAQLVDNLTKLSPTIPVGSGALKGIEYGEDEVGERADGPKWVVAGDFDNDGHDDFATCHNNGELTVVYGTGTGAFLEPVNFPSGTGALRSLIAGDYNEDGFTDIVAADPYAGRGVLWFGAADRTMVEGTPIDTFQYARNVTTGDFNGDGHNDLVFGGPDNPDLGGGITGVVYFTGAGDGTFTFQGNTPEVGLLRKRGRIKPVFSLEPFRRVGDTADRLGVTYEHASTMWVLIDDPLDGNPGLVVQKALSWWSNGDNSDYPVDSLEIGTLTQPAATGFIDLIAVQQGA